MGVATGGSDITLSSLELKVHFGVVRLNLNNDRLINH